MAKTTETVKGTVCEILPNNQYRVELHIGEKEVLCYVSGKMKKNHIRMLVGDHVDVVLDPYGGKATNRITRRL